MTLLKTVYSTSLTICFEIDNFMPIRKNKKNTYKVSTRKNFEPHKKYLGSLRE